MKSYDFDGLMFRMTDIVRRMERYASDFFAHDTKVLYDASCNPNGDKEWVWVVNECGTHLYTEGHYLSIKDSFTEDFKRARIGIYTIKKEQNLFTIEWRKEN